MQVAMPDNTTLIILPPEAACTPTNLPTKTPGADTGALPTEVILLQEEMNNAMGCLLTTRASVDTHQRKQVSDFKMALHQNEAKAAKAIREAKACCGAAIREVEVCCAADIREAESHCADQAYTIQQSHNNNMQCLEREAIKEERKNCQSFLATYGMALQVCPPRSPRDVYVPSPIANGEHVLGHPPGHSPQCQPPGRNPPP